MFSIFAAVALLVSAPVFAQGPTAGPHNTHYANRSRDDHGRDDHGRDDHGREDHGREDHGREDHGREDHGREDHGREDHGRKSKDFNYGFERNHRVTPQERTRWEACPPCKPPPLSYAC